MRTPPAPALGLEAAPDLDQDPDLDPDLDHGAASISCAEHHGYLHRYIRWLGLSWDAAEDVVQEAFVVWAAKPAEHVEASATWTQPAVRAYLRGIARRLVYAQRRAGQRLRFEPDVDPDTLFERAERERPARQDALVRCLAELSPRARLALDGIYRDGLDRAAVAERLGIRVGGVKTLLSRTKRALRRCIRQRLALEPRTTP